LRGTLVLACVSVLGLVAAAPGARASDEFETSFKYELGRIAAQEAASVAVHVLGAVYPYPQRYEGSADYYEPEIYPQYAPRHRHHYRHHHKHRWHKRHGHRHHRGHRHRHGRHHGDCS
jgi:hypothetical protein